MGATHFVLAFHNHQPVGNFENVFREAFEKCYDPFLRFLEEHAFLRVSLHYSGCLLDWLESREKQFLKRLERLVRRGQVEILGGGYYEPILPAIPERDAIRQLQYMNEYLKRRFGRKPTGFWLTERVWEQKVPRLASAAWLRYTALDDTHFALAGFSEREVKDFFITEEEGHPLYVFPIAKALRYAIPFQEPEKALDHLRDLGSENSEISVVTYADDGEKFGLWPGTYQWVYREGWLGRFARALEENRSWISLKTFPEVLKEWQSRPVRKAYLPAASYEEMTEWALGREKAVEFSKLKRDLESHNLWGRARYFFQGGTFKNFLTKYSEADWMRSKMRWVSRKVETLKGGEQRKRAETELWQGQCNCPYWHGVFGGLYLHHLRRNTYEHLIRAELLSKSATSKTKVHWFQEDLNQDGAEEIVIESSPFAFYFQPHRGGSLAELDFHPAAMNVLDTLTRREEAYHREALQGAGGGEGKSIHQMEKKIPPEVQDRLAFDSYERYSLVEHFLPSGITLQDFWKGKFEWLGGKPTEVLYKGAWQDKRGEAALILKGELPWQGGGNLVVEKRISVKPGEECFTVSWSLVNETSKKVNCLWGSEWNLTFYDRERDETGVRRIAIQDGWSTVHLEISSEEPFDYWQFPIETVAQTEKDFRLLHQGISVFPHWRLSLAPGKECRRSLSFRFSRRG